MNITLEKIDELRSRAKVSYTEAKEALEMFDGNIVDALAYLDKNDKVKSKGYNKSYENIGATAKELCDKGFKTRIIVKKDDVEKINLSANVAAICTVIGFHAVIPLSLVALATGHKFEIQKGDKKDEKVEEVPQLLEKNQ
ncbi:DUF4342 domain-containing protein [Oceanirhabdus sp. W0125-5]|uniref:DUF4342 domain-containing protein n=1 Tax=Oceanirhabdus sp. W0125-5 TaxID=2999116 RepID=UPI0022F34633|nr:DUF4342 domain-containing protein [Oceanirhabdus sp. W0125-5]WBW98770.1 DUF4342 domain-containing protein [Oceanirhabdus sp. W0125-5]